MASASSHFNRAVALHREAAAHTAAARAELAGSDAAAPASAVGAGEYQRLAEQLTRAAAAITPGWLGCDIDSSVRSRKLGINARLGEPMHVRLGTATPVPGCTFTVAAPFLGAGHLAIDRDARDRRVAGWLQGLLLRATAALPEGALRVLPVDGGTLGAVFAPFRQMVEAQVWRRPVTDVDGLRTVLDEAEAQITAAQDGVGRDLPYLLIACGALPPGSGGADHARLAALAHAGPAARVYLLLAGYPPAGPAGYDSPARLDFTTYLTATGDLFAMSEPPGPEPVDDHRNGLAVPVRLDPGPVDGIIETVCRPLASAARVQHAVDFTALMPERIWTESSAAGLRTAIGRSGRQPFDLLLDDVTPHWLVGGRTGSGKTVFLLDVLYGLASRYSPDELVLYLLDFKEGVSFADFTPTPLDGSWIPHARTVGIESDREYGLAVLRELAREMGRRAVELKRAGVTRIIDLRAGRPDVAMPRIVAVIDEFHVLFTGNDRVAAQAAATLEELARKGRSYGIHLVLASQTVAGVEALFTKGESIFGQFPLRVALAGGGGVLDHLNDAADNLPIGTAVINDAAGVPGANRTVRFPNTDPAAVTAQRHKLWHARTPGDPSPAVFAGYAEHHIDDDPTFRRLSPAVRRRQALVGRTIDVGLPTAAFTFDASPGRHLAVLGSSPVGADIVYAAVASLAREHAPGTVTFILGSLIAAADDAADAAAAAITAANHPVEIVDAAKLRGHLGHLAGTIATATPCYVAIFGADAASGLLATQDPTTFRSGLDDLRTLLHSGPSRGIHVLGWWRGVRRFSDDIGGTPGLEDIACLVALNIAANDLNHLLEDYNQEWHARPNRALLIDRHDDRTELIVPFVRPGTYDNVH
jgi:S-DNA-T family DNA segregation ATPase FtsK/SpoIIIE